MRGALAVGAWLLCGLLTCDESEQLAEVAENGRRARIVRVTTTHEESGGGHFGPSCSKTVRVQQVVLRIEGMERKLEDDWAETDRVALVAAPDGERFAYRKNDGPWRPVWVGKRHLLLGADAQQMAGDSVDWRAVPALAGAAKDIFQHAKHERSNMVDELRGTPALAALLADTLAAEGEIDDGWTEGFRALDASEQNALRAKLRKALLAGEKDPDIAMRFAVHAGIESEKERRAALQLLASSHTHAMRFRIKERLVVQAARIDLDDTAAWACGEVARYEPDKFFYPVELFWVMAKARLPCNAALPLLAYLSWCNLPESSDALNAKIDLALARLADEPAGKSGPYIHDREAPEAFAAVTISAAERGKRCRAAAP